MKYPAYIEKESNRDKKLILEEGYSEGQSAAENLAQSLFMLDNMPVKVYFSPTFTWNSLYEYFLRPLYSKKGLVGLLDNINQDNNKELLTLYIYSYIDGVLFVLQSYGVSINILNLDQKTRSYVNDIINYFIEEELI